VVHIHVRNPDESPSSNPDLFAQVQEGIVKHCPGMIVQFSTGGRGRDQNERGSMLHLKPDMASLATGSVNFAKVIYENTPQLVEQLAAAMLEYNVKPEIEVFDVAMLYNARNLADRGLLKRPCQVQFVMGIPNALPVRRKLLEFLLGELKEVMPDGGPRPVAVGSQSMVSGARRPCAHRDRGQHQIRQGPARPQQWRTGGAPGRPVRKVWTARRDPGGSAADLATAALAGAPPPARVSSNGNAGGFSLKPHTKREARRNACLPRGRVVGDDAARHKTKNNEATMGGYDGPQSSA
jgi:hypothetical protein